MIDIQEKCIGMVYSMTNSSSSNEVICYKRNDKGELTQLMAYKTGGCGTGEEKADPLSSQGSLILTTDNRFLFAVNAGSNTISCFCVSQDGSLQLTDTVSSRGIMPVSIAVCHNLLYVANVGHKEQQMFSSIVGFFIDSDGRLTYIENAVYALSEMNARPSCIVFNSWGNQLVVSELSTNKLSVYDIDRDGTLTCHKVYNSNGSGPFGSVFLSNGILLIAESGVDALSSYTNCNNGSLMVVSGSVEDQQKATCWVCCSEDAKHAYTSNAGSGTLTQYNIKPDGCLEMIGSIPTTLKGTSAPTDSGTSKDGQNLYLLNGNKGTISVFCIMGSGQLRMIQELDRTGLPLLGAQGLAVL